MPAPIQANDERWLTLTKHPGGNRPAAAFAAPIDLDRERIGVLAVIIELTRVSNFLSHSPWANRPAPSSSTATAR